MSRLKLAALMALLSYPFWVVGCRFAKQFDHHGAFHATVVNPDWPAAFLQAAGCSLGIFVIALLVVPKDKKQP